MLILIIFDPEIPLWEIYPRNINQNTAKSWCANIFFRVEKKGSYPNV